MSLLMDALKKAEREKNKAASLKNTEDTIEEADLASENTKAGQVSSEQSIDNDPDITVAQQKDEDWAFETGELELEPLAKKIELFDESPDNKHPSLADDTTVREKILTAPTLSETVSSDIDNDQTVKSDTGLHKSDFDQDATLPSERAIQTSLQDYFEVSQSITMDQNTVGESVIDDITEPTLVGTSPHDTSATHVTAHTIFTAGGRARRPSTGLAKYALFGTLFLAVGLGTVALYYSFVTPTPVDMSTTTLPTVAKMAESEGQPKSPEVDVKTVEITPESELATISPDREDPELEKVVEDVASATVDQPEQTTTPEQQMPSTVEVVPEDPQTIEVEESSEAPIAESIAVEENVEADPVVSSEVTEELVVMEEAPVEPPADTTSQRITSKPQPEQKPEDSIVELPQNETITKNEIITKPQPEEAIILKDEQYQSEVLKGGFSLQDSVVANEQPIEVMSAEDFAEDLKVPKSAIKITKGRTHRASSSDLSMAYQAYQAGDYLSAKSAYRKVLNNRPGSRDARLGIAAIAVLERNYETAYRHYQYLFQQNPKDQIVNAALFNLQGNAGGHVDESQLKLLLDKNPDFPQLNFSLGNSYARQSRWPEAQQAFFKAFSADKHNADYAYNLAVSLDQMGQTTSALSYYRSALKLADKAPVSFNTSRVLARIQKLSGIVKN